MAQQCCLSGIEPHVGAFLVDVAYDWFLAALSEFIEVSTEMYEALIPEFAVLSQPDEHDGLLRIAKFEHNGAIEYITLHPDTKELGIERV